MRFPIRGASAASLSIFAGWSAQALGFANFLAVCKCRVGNSRNYPHLTATAITGRDVLGRLNGSAGKTSGKTAISNGASRAGGNVCRVVGHDPGKICVLRLFDVAFGHRLCRTDRAYLPKPGDEGFFYTTILRYGGRSVWFDECGGTATGKTGARMSVRMRDSRSACIILRWDMLQK